MAGLIVVCPRFETPSDHAVDDVLSCAKLMEPDNIAVRPTQVRHENGFIVAVVNPAPDMRQQGASMCIGSLYGSTADWWKPGAPAPDGSYVLCRYAPPNVELMSDALGSRTVWYVETENALLASTSQRVLVALLGDHHLDEQAVTWMLCSGHLGWEASWDSRVRRLPSNGRLTLDRRDGRVAVQASRMSFAPQEIPEDEHVERLKEALLGTCSSLDLRMEKWLLPLSGGLDSRALLYALLAVGKRPRCVTWGLRSSLADPRNDASIAQALAHRLSVEHTYCSLDDTAIALDEALTRFVLLSEGKTEDFAAYTDGFAMWKSFFDSGVTGVIRGDEAPLGYYASYSSFEQARLRSRLLVLSDYRTGHTVRRLGLAETTLPPALDPLPDENVILYQARIAEESFIASVLAPLNDLKSRYCDVVNPLQSRAILDVTHRMPTTLRTERKSLKEVVRQLGPELPYASSKAPQTHSQLLGRQDLADEIRTWLEADVAERVLSRDALRTVIAGLRVTSASTAKRRLRRSIKAVVPQALARTVKPLPTVALSGRQLAFRTYLAVRIADVLAEDARLLKR